VPASPEATPRVAGVAGAAEAAAETGAAEVAGAPVARSPFEYAIVRVVPKVERGEAFNAGIVLMSRPRRFIGARTELDAAVLVAMAPDCDPGIVRAHLASIERIAAGDPEAGPIARLTAPERFHWLVSPSSTIIQPSDVHTGLTSDPAATLDHLFRTLVQR
jgi:Protein of unknown function (DUF3037)